MQYSWGTEEGIGSLRTRFTRVTSYLVDAGNKTQVLCKSSCAYTLSHLSSPTVSIEIEIHMYLEETRQLLTEL